MNTNFKKDHASLDLIAFMHHIQKKRLLLIYTTSFFLFLFTFYAFFQPDIYKSESILAPGATQDSESLGLGSSFSKLAGISGPAEKLPRYILASKVITSKNFFKELYQDDLFLAYVMAFDSYDSQAKKNIFLTDIFNIDKLSWSGGKPSFEESYESFTENNLNIDVDDEWGITTIQMRHQSPDIAFDMLNKVLEKLNNYIVRDEMQISKKRFEFLENKISTTNNKAVREIFSLSAEKELQNIVSLETQEDYIYRTLDSPMTPEVKSGPNRIIIILIGLFIGLIFSLIYIFMGLIFGKKVEQ
jgi:LPS O-antigen subunit length determinant protein (WzzB/FepE family)